MTDGLTEANESSESANASRLTERNLSMWRDWCSGMTQDAIAEKYGITRGRVSQVMTEVRSSLPEADVKALVLRELGMAEDIRSRALFIADLGPTPAYSNGKRMEDDNGDAVQDYSTVLSALDRVMKAGERVSKLLGLDAAQKVEATVTSLEREATSAAADAALAFLEGGTGDPTG